MGISVINGAMAIFKPSLLLCLRVSEMTMVNRGPGDIPAVSPKTAPIDRYVIVCGIIPMFCYGFLTACTSDRII